MEEKGEGSLTEDRTDFELGTRVSGFERCFSIVSEY
jgi:hypothetical protein